MTLGAEERLAVLERACRDFVLHHAQIHEAEHREVERRSAELVRRLDEMNQFREQINTERGEFVRRESYDERHEALIRRVVALERNESNLQGRMVIVGAVVTVLVSLVVVAVNLFFKRR